MIIRTPRLLGTPEYVIVISYKVEHFLSQPHKGTLMDLVVLMYFYIWYYILCKQYQSQAQGRKNDIGVDKKPNLREHVRLGSL